MKNTSHCVKSRDSESKRIEEICAHTRIFGYINQARGVIFLYYQWNTNHTNANKTDEIKDIFLTEVGIKSIDSIMK